MDDQTESGLESEPSNESSPEQLERQEELRRAYELAYKVLARLEEAEAEMPLYQEFYARIVDGLKAQMDVMEAAAFSEPAENDVEAWPFTEGAFFKRSLSDQFITRMGITEAHHDEPNQEAESSSYCILEKLGLLENGDYLNTRLKVRLDGHTNVPEVEAILQQLAPEAIGEEEWEKYAQGEEMFLGEESWYDPNIKRRLELRITGASKLPVYRVRDIDMTRRATMKRPVKIYESDESVVTRFLSQEKAEVLIGQALPEVGLNHT